MAAPPGFDPNASVLPDPGASSAPIHVMRGGGMKGGAKEDILRAYKLAEGQELASKFTEEEKEKFVAAINSGGCNWTTKFVLDAKCAPVVNVLKALLKQKIRRVNANAIPEKIKVSSESSGSWLNTLTKGLKKAPATPAVVKVDVEDNENENNDAEVEMSGTLGLNEIAAPENSPFAGLNTSVFENEPENNVVQNIGLEVRTEVKNSPENFQGNRSRRRANLKLNLTRKNNRKLYSNFNINSNPIRIYGNTPSNIAKRYNFEVTKSRKLKGDLQKAEGALTLEKQNLAYQTAKRARAESEKLIAEKRKLNAEKAAKLKASQTRAAELKAQAAAAEKEHEELEIASGLRKPAKPGFFTRAKSMWPFGKKGGSRKNRRTRRKTNRK